MPIGRIMINWTPFYIHREK